MINTQTKMQHVYLDFQYCRRRLHAAAVHNANLLSSCWQ